MAKLTVFTWNLNNAEDAVEPVCEHLSQQGSFVAALQEVPSLELSKSLEIVAARYGLRLLSRTTVSWNEEKSKAHEPKVVLLSSDDIEVDPLGERHESDLNLDDNRRLEGFTLLLKAQRWHRLQVLGIHGIDLLNNPVESLKRTTWAQRMRAVLDKFWTKGPLVVMGDLNANPWSPEVTARHGLFAIREKDWPKKGEDVKQEGSAKRAVPLYNPMWRLLPDSSDDQRGTYYHGDNDHDLSWHCLDQIILSEHLREHAGAPQVLTRLSGRDLVNKIGNIVISDHLPVQMTVELKEG